MNHVSHNIEIEGRVRIDYGKNAAERQQILDLLWTMVKEKVQEEYKIVQERAIIGTDVYIIGENNKLERMRDLWIKDKEGFRRYVALETKDLGNELGRGKYGIRALEERVLKRYIDSEEALKTLGSCSTVGMVDCARRELNIRHKELGSSYSVTVDDVPKLRPSVYMEYEINNPLTGVSRDDCNGVVQKINSLEEFVESYIKPLVDEARKELDARYEWEYKTYPEMTIPQTPMEIQIHP